MGPVNIEEMYKVFVWKDCEDIDVTARFIQIENYLNFLESGAVALMSCNGQIYRLVHIRENQFQICL